jgi:hypothetical protein
VLQQCHAGTKLQPNYLLFVRSARGWQHRPADYPVDGLNTLLYNVKSVETKWLYTKVLINLPPTPKDVNEAYHVARTLFVDAVAFLSH